MNTNIIIAACLSSFMLIGHFAFGIKWYLQPMLKSEMAKIPKATMQSVFHYVSVFLVLSASTLILISFGYLSPAESSLLVKFIGLNYLVFGIVQIVYSFNNKIEKPLITMFQWTMFIPIGILCLI